ncbi:TRAP transporter small permease [Cohaesibacter gelatinilyticus]|uniref:TRAP transporter small permease protein n=1 Tax=Cohaesibacter gelatinilyticus TaxID=372072 RepID=A0A285PH63_9HYPH|nr:TRAP transporter small permease [Cohaesibacter gelatinilyticus]SNZ20623.1 TRAP-type C4-dicarboxylate transport system, small permease component [Cohaesibacter gelatinilyticus]HAT86854.1 TRAP transporter small permease [Hyphomicrobiales bacterium]
MTHFLKFCDRLESYICRFLLVCFVSLLFTQVVSRQIFGTSITWIEELSVFMFVWFVYFGASYAARISAHNRVSFHFRWLPAKVGVWLEAFADLIWVSFNIYFVYLAYDFIFFRMNKFWKAQTLGVELKYIYLVLPIAFALMTIRILQVNYLKLVKGVDIKDPDKIDLPLEDELNDVDGTSATNNTNNGGKA